MLEPQPSIELFGLVIQEPVNTLTDIFVSIICFVAYLKLNALSQRSEVQGLFKYYFPSMSLATLLGGVLGHALMHFVPFYMKLPGWITSMLSVALLERALIQYSRKWIDPKIGAFFSKLNIIELLAFLILLLVTLNFQFVLIHAAYGIAIVVTGFTGFVYFKKKIWGASKYYMQCGSVLLVHSFLFSKLG